MNMQQANAERSTFNAQRRMQNDCFMLMLMLMLVLLLVIGKP